MVRFEMVKIDPKLQSTTQFPKYMWQSDVELYRYMLCLFFRLNLWLNLEYTRRGNVCVYIGGKRNMTRIYKKWV